jgi:hypothetical protein
MKLFLFAECRILEHSVACQQSPPVSALQMTLFMQNLQVLANGDLGCPEMPGKFRDQHAAVTVKNFENGSPTFFV